MKRLCFLSVLLLLFSCSLHDGEPNSQTPDSRVARIESGLIPDFWIKGADPVPFNINERLDELGIPGLSVAFVADGKIEWARAYGMSSVAENRPMETDTMLLA